MARAKGLFRGEKPWVVWVRGSLAVLWTITSVMYLVSLRKMSSAVKSIRAQSPVE
jgi:hypothetical protein